MRFTRNFADKIALIPFHVSASMNSMISDQSVNKEDEDKRKFSLIQIGESTIQIYIHAHTSDVYDKTKKP